MQQRPLCPECGSHDVHVGDAVAACNACGYWGSSQHFFAHEVAGRSPAQPALAAISAMRKAQRVA